MDKSMFETNWIWYPGWNSQDDAAPGFIYFRKELHLDAQPEKCVIQISADSRYKLYINGTFVQEGPGKGDLETWYCDEADLTPFLRQGSNVAAVEVLRYPENIKYRNHSLFRTPFPCLYAADEQIVMQEGEAAITFNGKSGWKCRKADNISIVPDPIPPATLQILEDAKGEEGLKGWKETGFDDSGWQDARPYTFFEMQQTVSPFHLVKRNIPYQKHKDRRFSEVVCIRNEDVQNKVQEKGQAGIQDAAREKMQDAARMKTQDAALEKMQDAERTKTQDTAREKDAWEIMLHGKGSIVIPAHSSCCVEISAGELMTGYLKLSMARGAGSRVTIHCAEAYAYPPDGSNRTNMPVKGDRTDYENGRLYGYKDHYTAAGYGTVCDPEYYEPYWFRTFRFIELTVETCEEELELLEFSYRQTGYPLEVRTSVKTDDPTLDAIWDISLRTLRRCMHETYMDCPFYEQLQYAMDSRSEILFTYCVAADDRLARKCMEDFRRSQRSDGMIAQSAPNAKTGVIPGFSVYYILMVYDHMMYFGDKELVKDHLPAIDSVLRFFDRHLNEEGMVGKVGGPIMRQPYWSFIDWTAQWNSTAGVPTSVMKGPVTMESLLYILGLQKAAQLADYAGRFDVAAEYRSRAIQVKEAVLSLCMGENHLIQDGPGVEEYSVHCQVFSILTNIVTPKEGRKMLEATVGKEEYAQCSVAMSFYLFRALEKSGWYEKSNDIWNTWRKMVEDHLTTCVENDTDARSDCHAWGAAVLYELPAVVLGVRPLAPGFGKVKIAPLMGYLSEASGDVVTPAGMVHVEWKREENGACRFSYEVPEGMMVEKG